MCSSSYKAGPSEGAVQTRADVEVGVVLELVGNLERKLVTPVFVELCAVVVSVKRHLLLSHQGILYCG